jgi:pyruvate dehydrogenase phosphatase
MQHSGHGGTETPEFTIQYLPGRIHAALQTLCSPTDGLDTNFKEQFQESISALISEEIERFDREIGEAVTILCKDPRKLTEAQARLLIEKHAETLSRAYHGTTLTVALINLTREGLWVAGVGDSTVCEYGQIEIPDLNL